MTLFAIVSSTSLAATFLWLLLRLRQESRMRAAARAGYFKAVEGMFQSVVTRVEPSGFARMSGVWDGLAFDLQAVPDTLTFRKLPALWVLVTLTEPVAVATELHIMARPGQSDVYSTFDKMPVSVKLPDGYPDHCAMHCADATLLPDRALIAAHAPLFATGLVKELVMSPKGLRLVVLGEEAERGAYLLFRDAEMGREGFAADRLLPLLKTLAALKITLNAEKEQQRG